MDNKTIAKKTVKLIDLIPGSKTKKGNEIMVNPCPICNHNDHFSINTEKNIYTSHSKCCSGGSVIDWFIESQHMTIGTSIKHVISLAGLDDKKISLHEQKKLMANKLKLDYKSTNEKRIIKSSYHKLTMFERALRNIKDKDIFLNWLLSFIETYTTRFVIANSHKELLDLCYGFKKEFSYCYDNFLNFENDLNDLIELVEKK